MTTRTDGLTVLGNSVSSERVTDDENVSGVNPPLETSVKETGFTPTPTDSPLRGLLAGSLVILRLIRLTPKAEDSASILPPEVMENCVSHCSLSHFDNVVVDLFLMRPGRVDL